MSGTNRRSLARCCLPLALVALGAACSGGGSRVTLAHTPTTSGTVTTTAAPITTATSVAPTTAGASARTLPSSTSTAAPTTPTTPTAATTARATTTTAANTTPGPVAGLALQAVRGQTIVLDPGHNGGNWSSPSVINQQVFIGNGYKACDTTGTETDGGYTEAAFNFDVASRLASLLQAAGAKVILTRTNNTGVGPCVTQRAQIGNLAHAAVALSIHADGGPPGGRGFQVLEPAPISGYNTAIVAPSDRLGLDVRRDFQAATGEEFSTYAGTDALETRSDLGGLNLSTVPKVFIECANMRNSADASVLVSAAFRQKIADGLAQALADFLAGR